MTLAGLRCKRLIGIKFRFFSVSKFDSYEILFVSKHVRVAAGKLKVADPI